MNRRSFLLGTGTVALSQVLAGCGSRTGAKLRVQVLNGSIPTQLVNQFRQSLKQPAELEFAPTEQLNDLFTQLQSWRKQPNDLGANWWLPRLPLPWIKSKPSLATDLVTLGDYWLAPAIQQGLIQSLDPAQLGQWPTLPQRWQQLVKRNDLGYLDAQGKVWAAPYSWGTTVIVYNRDKFQSLKWTPRDWNDLWREEVRDRISLLDQPREVIGLTLKKLGHSYNTENLEKVPDLKKELDALNRQAKFYSSDTYLEPLILGDTWLAVGWSTDVLPILQRYQQIAAVIPQSGTALWANLWVQPARDVRSAPLDHQWIDFCWQPQIAQQISLLSKATSPIPVTLNSDDIQKESRSILSIEPQIFQRSEFLQPLPATTLPQYQSLWQAMRQQVAGG